VHLHYDGVLDREKKNILDCGDEILQVLIPFQTPSVSILKACVLQSSYRGPVDEIAIQIPSVMNYG
jgi:hypothetical protein